MKRPKTSKRRDRGFTLIEIMIAAAILATLGAAIGSSLLSLQDLTTAGSTVEYLQKMGEKANSTILNDLKYSGTTIVAGKNFPYIFDDGNAQAPFAAHAHAAAQHAAVFGDADAGASREIVFALPLDADGNEIPDLDGAGNLTWSATEFSYVLVTLPNGINQLQRQTNAANPVRVADYVERVAFETNAEDVTIPLNAVRVRIFFRYITSSENRLFKHQTEFTVRLRN